MKEIKQLYYPDDDHEQLYSAYGKIDELVEAVNLLSATVDVLSAEIEVLKTKNEMNSLNIELKA